MSIERPMSVVERAMAHVPQLVLSGRGHEVVHGAHAAGRFNRWLAVPITGSVGSMWCAYAFALIALISLPAALASGSPIVIVSWVAQTFLQLVLLPIIIVGQNVQAAASDARAEADHATLNALLRLTTEVHSINEQQTAILKRLEASH